VPPRLRRLLFIVTAGACLARVYVLGEERGWALVGPTALRVVALSLAAWLAHLVLHELAHLVAARTQGFVVRGVRLAVVTLDLAGPRPRLRWGGDLGGGVNSLPRGGEALPARLRRVALAGPAATLAATLALTAAWARGPAPSLASPLGIFVVMGGLVLVTALLPGALLPRRPDSGSDLDQLLQPRAVLAHWTNAAAIEAVVRGAPLEGALDWRATDALLPTAGPAEPFELGWCYACLEAGERGRARERLERLAANLADDAPEWLRTDVAMQRGLLAALDARDPGLARTCLAEVEAHQALDWYAGLLRAAIAHADGDDAAAGAHLDAWLEAAARHPQQGVLLSGNRWALRSLGRTPGIAPVTDAAVR
jgi:hypothetical protein